MDKNVMYRLLSHTSPSEVFKQSLWVIHTLIKIVNVFSTIIVSITTDDDAYMTTAPASLPIYIFILKFYLAAISKTSFWYI